MLVPQKWKKNAETVLLRSLELDVIWFLREPDSIAAGKKKHPAFSQKWAWLHRPFSVESKSLSARLLGQKCHLPHKSAHNPTFEAKPLLAIGRVCQFLEQR